MVRIYKELLQRCLLVMLHYRDLGYNLKQSGSYYLDYWMRSNRSPYFRSEVRTALSSVEDGSLVPSDTDISKLVDDIVSQLDTKGEFRDRDLIDTIVRTIGLPYARNAIAGSSLDSLRVAILLPEEIVNLKTSLEKETFCVSCGHKFMSGEMATYNGVSRGSRGFLCTRCTQPSYMASIEGPDTSVHIPTSVVAALKDKKTIKGTKKSSPFEEAFRYSSEFIGSVGPNPVAVDAGQQTVTQSPQPDPVAAYISSFPDNV